MNFQEKAFESVQETTKLLITIATAFVAFTVSFAKDFRDGKMGSDFEKTVWCFGSIFLVLSVGCGIWTQLAITTVLEPTAADQSRDAETRSIRNRKVKVPFAVQLLTFGTGVILMGLYQAIGVWSG